jgi:hypothetical protein
LISNPVTASLKVIVAGIELVFEVSAEDELICTVGLIESYVLWSWAVVLLRLPAVSATERAASVSVTIPWFCGAMSAVYEAPPPLRFWSIPLVTVKSSSVSPVMFSENTIDTVIGLMLVDGCVMEEIVAVGSVVSTMTSPVPARDSGLPGSGRVSAALLFALSSKLEPDVCGVRALLDV